MGDERKDKQKQQERRDLNEEQRKDLYRNDRQREHGTGDGGAELRERHDEGKNHKDKV